MHFKAVYTNTAKTSNYPNNPRSANATLRLWRRIYNTSTTYAALSFACTPNAFLCNPCAANTTRLNIARIKQHPSATNTST